MPIRKQNRRAIRRQSEQINLQIPPELADATKELLSEILLAKRKERTNQEIQRTKLSLILNWVKDNATALATLITLLSAIWTVNQYFIQKSQSEKLQRQTMIAQFAGDLSDKTKRNSSAYALATLAGEDAIPLLTSELKQNALFENDLSYQNAISQSLISIGKPALDAVVAINREKANSGGGFPDEENQKIILATQPVITYFMVNNLDAFQNPQALKFDNKIVLENMFIQNASFAYADFSNIDFSQIWLTESGLCRASFENTNLQDSYFLKLSMGNNNFDDATITNTSFHNSNLENSSFKNLNADQVNFSATYLVVSNWVGANIKNSDFSSAELESANFGNANLTNVDFGYIKSRRVDFNKATLTSSNFSGAYLEDANFSGADLMDVKFFQSQDDLPYSLTKALNQDGPTTFGAFVRDANFSNALNIDEPTRIYLCTWGAVNVPGGCVGIEKKDTSAVKKPSGSSAGSCF